MRNLLNILENSFLGLNAFLGLSLTLDDVHAVLGIVMLVFQILVIITKAVFKIYEKIKSKKFEEIPEVLEEAVDDLGTLKQEGGEDSEENQRNVS